MLNALISSKTKRAILRQFLSNPEQKYYVRQLALILDISVGTIHRELAKLERNGILNSESIGNLRFFYANKMNPLFKELKQIIFKTEGIEGSLKDLINKYKGISSAFIYGSYAKNKEKKTSDIDLVLVGKFPTNEFMRGIRDLESKLNREINFTTYSEDEFNNERKKEGGFMNLVLKDKIVILKDKLNDR